VDKILAERCEKYICLDRAFAGNDQFKTNTVLQMEAEKVELKVICETFVCKFGYLCR
jgi:hypothetical protein